MFSRLLYTKHVAYVIISADVRPERRLLPEVNLFARVVGVSLLNLAELQEGFEVSYSCGS